MPIIQINVHGKKPFEVKEKLVAKVTEAASSALGEDPAIVRVIINEMDPENFAVAGKTMARRAIEAKK